MLKQEVLFELKNSEKAVSGQILAEKFGVSRNAVWKAVNSLKAEGYVITGANKSGYKLERFDALTPEIFAEDFNKYRVNRAKNQVFEPIDVICKDVLDSTNNEAKRIAANVNSVTVITADRQTAGRGRLGRSFYSPSLTGAYFSIILHGERDFADAVKFTSLAAVAVCRALENLTATHPMIKWVNDVYLNNKKICGILTESITDMESGKVSDVIVGIGINLTTEFPEDLNTAGSVFCKTITRSRIISATVYEILQEMPYIAQNRHIKYYREHSYLTGKHINYYANGIKYEGYVNGISDDGGLIVTGANGEKTCLTSGEVTVKIKKENDG